MHHLEQRATKLMASYKISFLRGCLVTATVAALGLAAPAAAQQTTPTPQTPPQPQVKLVEKAKHGDWSITCPEATDKTEKPEKTENDPSGKGDLDTANNDKNNNDQVANCFMVQAARHSEKKELAVSVMVFKNVVEGKTISQMRVNVPAQFYVLLPAGIGLEIDGDSEHAQQLQYMFCPPPGLCIAVKELDDDLLAKLKAGTMTKLYVWDVRRRGAIFELSLKGFTKAFEEM